MVDDAEEGQLKGLIDLLASYSSWLLSSRPMRVPMRFRKSSDQPVSLCCHRRSFSTSTQVMSCTACYGEHSNDASCCG
jgi:hypothetical protein